jgi:hypothetical protein
MTETTPSEADISASARTRGRPKAQTIALTKAARARFDTLAAESIEAVFQAVLTAATQDGDMAAAKLLIDRVIPSRRGAPVSFHIRPLKTAEDCACAYADLLDDVGAGRLTPVPVDRAGDRDRSPEGAARCSRGLPTLAARSAARSPLPDRHSAGFGNSLAVPGGTATLPDCLTDRQMSYVKSFGFCFSVAAKK